MGLEVVHFVRRFHMAIGVADVAATIVDYSKRLGCEPAVIVEGQYAMWQTATLNFSIRLDPVAPGTLRHIGWEDPAVNEVSMERDINGLQWERFSAELQLAEIRSIWPISSISS